MLVFLKNSGAGHSTMPNRHGICEDLLELLYQVDSKGFGMMETSPDSYHYHLQKVPLDVPFCKPQ
jgi:hypothetical protein